MTLRSKPVVTLVPMTEGDQVAVRQLAAFRHAGRAGSVKKDEEAVGGRGVFKVVKVFKVFKVIKVLCQQHFALVLVHNVAQLLICNK